MHMYCQDSLGAPKHMSRRSVISICILFMAAIRGSKESIWFGPMCLKSTAIPLKTLLGFFE